MNKVSCCVFLCLVVYGLAHSTQYPHLKIQDPNSPPEGPVPILSFHAHITYTVFNQKQINAAMALREQIREGLAEYLGPDCDGRYDYGYLCMIADHDFNTTLEGGPFVSGEWSIFIPVPYYQLVVPYLFQHRGQFSLVIHPNTGYENEDHTIWAMWAGEPWPLDLTIFTPGTQTNEFGQTRGDAGNPICLSDSAVCGDSTSGPTTLCCFGSTCAAAETIPQVGADPLTLYRCQ